MIFEKGALKWAEVGEAPKQMTTLWATSREPSIQFEKNRSKNLRALVIFKIFEKGALKWA